MANLIESSTYEPAIHEIGVEEFVLGGLNGPSNTPLKQLANRTKWLKDAVDALESGGGPFAYNASAGTLPAFGTDGAGVAGIKRKDYYFVTVPGTVSGVTLQIGDALIAMVDDADVIAEFIVSQSNAELATPSVIGMVKLVQNISGGSLVDAVLSTAGLISLFAQKASPALTGVPTTTTPADADSSQQIANTLWVLARILEEATARANAISAEANARANADSTLQNNINTLAASMVAADTNLNNIKANKADATVWTDLNLGIYGVAQNNKPQWRINQFGEMELRGSYSVSVVISGNTNWVLASFIDLPVPIKTAMLANSYFIDKFFTIPFTASFGSFILSPVPATISFSTAGGVDKINVSIGDVHGTGFAPGTYTLLIPLNGLRFQITS
jgi:hypothetical protein